jgi:hypothetical protein
VDVLEPPQHLVEEELVVFRGEVVVGLDDLVVEGSGWQTVETQQISRG